ncbi:hypothetical protein VIOR3934_07438 [Vibrio orientalis CIP 102891 = ATCC 33934]|uniref:Transposase n=2 Tax=Vibrio orientalis CIP 102891 = ATCC 33934 TaxID=675816 RepID=F9SXL3_VIBOR|nr:hypothetical protein VIOR3934_07438 [Vibrio orientalis CIP 102891 = ATCC 33934]
MKSTGRIYDKAVHRMTFEEILYRMRTSIPWRDLPSEFEWVFLDGSIVRADQHSTGAATESSEQIGKVAGATQPKFT